MFKQALIAAVATASFASAPVVAQTSAAKLSVARAGATVEGQRFAAGNGLLLAGIFFAALAVGIIFEDDLFGDDEPASN